jgi:hypothetical protein
MAPPLDFPDSPILSQDFRAGPLTWEWVGGVWRFKSASNQATPKIDSLEPLAVGLSDQPLTVTVRGSGFDTTTLIFLGTYDVASNRPNLRPQGTTTFVSPNEMTFEVNPAAYAQPELLYVTARNGTVNAPPPLSELKVIANPTLTDITPDDTSTDIDRDAKFVLTVDGTGFNSDPACPTILYYDDQPIPFDPTFTATRLTATVPKEAVAKIARIAVSSGTVAMTSPDLPLEFVEVPRIVPGGINPPRVDNIVTSQVLQIAGSGFTPDCVVVFDGAEIATTFHSFGLLECTRTPNTLASGAHNVAVRSKRGVDYTSANEVWTIDIVAPLIASITPTSVTQDTAGFTLTVNGSQFTHETDITVAGVVQATTLVSPTQLTCAMPMPVLDGPVSVAVNVKTMAVVGTAPDQPLAYPNPRPVLTNITPDQIKTSADPMNTYLTVDGSNFQTNSLVKNDYQYGMNDYEDTTYVSPTQLRMMVKAFDYAANSTVNVRVETGPYRSIITLPLKFVL